MNNRKLILLIVILVFTMLLTGCGNSQYEGSWKRVKNDVIRYTIDFYNGKFKSKFYYEDDYEIGDYSVELKDGATIISLQFKGDSSKTCYMFKDGKLCSMDNCTKCEYYLDRN